MFIEQDLKLLRSSGGAQCLALLDGHRAPLELETNPSMSSINIWPLCGHTNWRQDIRMIGHEFRENGSA